MQNKELTLRQKLDAFAAEGKEVKVTWEGGNDSGSYSVFIGEQEFDWGDPLYHEIVDVVSDVIDYGSWAGDYYADGHVIYNPDEGAFIGEGKDNVTEIDRLENIAIEVRIPKALNFDSVEIETQGDFSSDGVGAGFRFVVNNGPVFKEHADIEESQSTLLTEEVNEVLSSDRSISHLEIGWVSNDIVIPREEFKEDGDDMVYVIDGLDFYYNNTKYDSHHISIED